METKQKASTVFPSTKAKTAEVEARLGPWRVFSMVVQANVLKKLS